MSTSTDDAGAEAQRQPPEIVGGARGDDDRSRTGSEGSHEHWQTGIEKEFATGLKVVLTDVVTSCDKQLERVSHSQTVLSNRLAEVETSLLAFKRNLGGAYAAEEGSARTASSQSTVNANEARATNTVGGSESKNVFVECTNKVRGLKVRLDGVNGRVKKMMARLDALNELVRRRGAEATAVVEEERERRKNGPKNNANDSGEVIEDNITDVSSRMDDHHDVTAAAAIVDGKNEDTPAEGRGAGAEGEEEEEEEEEEEGELSSSPTNTTTSTPVEQRKEEAQEAPAVSSTPSSSSGI